MRINFPYVGAAYLLLIRDGNILLARRYHTGFMDGHYSVPAGHLDGNETVREGCAREMREEIGISVNVADLDVVHVMFRKSERDERIDFFMTAKTYEGEIRNVEPEKCDDLRWFPLNALPNTTIEYVRIAIEHACAGTFYSEYGWEARAEAARTVHTH